jgi:hypothetical protein
VHKKLPRDPTQDKKLVQKELAQPVNTGCVNCGEIVNNSPPNLGTNLVLTQVNGNPTPKLLEVVARQRGWVGSNIDDKPKLVTTNLEGGVEWAIHSAAVPLSDAQNGGQTSSCPLRRTSSSSRASFLSKRETS